MIGLAGAVSLHDIGQKTRMFRNGLSHHFPRRRVADAYLAANPD